MLGLIGTIALEKVLQAIYFVKIGYWAPKEQKQQSTSKKGPKEGGTKSEKRLSQEYDSVRPRNWQMLRTNWYNCFKRGFMG